MIKQILPIPDSQTALHRAWTQDGDPYYIDAIAAGKTVLYALITTDSGIDRVSFYTQDCVGDPDLLEDDEDVILAPTMYCQKCGKRMAAYTTPDEPKRVRYRCTCGETQEENFEWMWVKDESAVPGE